MTESVWERGERLELAGDILGSLDCYQQASVSGVEPPTPRTALRHAEQLEGRGDLRAEAYFRQALRHDNPSVQAQGWRGLAAIHVALGDIPAGIEALKKIVATGDPDEGPRAWRNLGVQFEDLGRLDAASNAYEHAIAARNPRHSPGAMVNLGQLLEGLGDVSGAQERWRQAIASGHPTEAPRAHVQLGMLLQQQSEPDAALLEYEAAIGDPADEWSQRAALQSAGLLLERGDQATAAARLRVATRLADPREAAIAQCVLGLTELELGDHDAARAAFTAAREHGDEDIRAQASRKLAELEHAPRPDGGRDLISSSSRLAAPTARAALQSELGTQEQVLRVVDGTLMRWPSMDRTPGTTVLTETRIIFVPEAQQKRFGGARQASPVSYPHAAMTSLGWRVEMLHVANHATGTPRNGDWFIDVGGEADTRAFALAIIACPAYGGAR